MEETKSEEVTPTEVAQPTVVTPVKGKKNYTIPVILIILLIGAVGYIGYDKWQTSVQERELEVYTLGAEYGYEFRLLEIFNEGLNCEEPININNGSLEINLIAIECLNVPPA